MSKKSGFFRFQKLMADFAAEHIDPLASQLFAGEVIDQPPDESFKAIFFGFTDISATLDALKLTEALVGLSPPSRLLKYSSTCGLPPLALALFFRQISAS